MSCVEGSVRLPGKSASSGDSFKILLFSASEGQEPCFQKGRVRHTALIRSPSRGGSCLRRPSQVTTALCVTYGSVENLKGGVELDLENSESTQVMETNPPSMQTSSFNKMNAGTIYSGVPDARVRFIHLRDRTKRIQGRGA